MKVVFGQFLDVFGPHENFTTKPPVPSYKSSASKGNRLQQKDLKFWVAGEFIMSFTPDAYVLFLLFVCHIDTTHVLPGTNDIFTY